jgi:hypothetical protein
MEVEAVRDGEIRTFADVGRDLVRIELGGELVGERPS